ncbi:hypothetical protein IAU60_000953 [Kwoniella sp. DSM 27419]
MPYISTETLIGAALLLVLTVGYQYLPQNEAGSVGSKAGSGSSKSAKKKAAKKKGKGGAGLSESGTSGTSTPVVELPSTGEGTANESSQPRLQPQPTQPRKKLLAEKLLPKTPKTRVDDMLAPEDRPAGIARVMKVSSGPSSKKQSASYAQASGGSAAPATPAASEVPVGPSSARDSSDDEDNEDSEGEGEGVTGSASRSMQDTTAQRGSHDDQDDDGFEPVQLKKKQVNDGWNVVAAKKKTSTGGSSDPWRQTTSQSSAHASLENKNSKKNAKKAEAKKLARAAEEEDRQRRLASHKRDLERERINELYAAKQSNTARGKVLGSGPKATVTSNGKLVWD